MMKLMTLAALFTSSLALGHGLDRGPAGIFDIFKRSDSGPSTSGGNVMKCKKCSVPFSDENYVQFESLAKCSPQRRYLQDQLLQISPIYNKKRESSEGTQFPVACIVHAQRTLTMKTKEKPEDSEPNKWAGYEVPFRFFARCDTPDGEPVRGQFMPCVTQEYSYTVYNAFSDVMDCFGINGRKILPKLWNESGFHINALGGGFDGGVGQMTKSALQEVLTPPFSTDERTALDIFKASAMASDKASCKRLVEYERAFDVVSIEAANRCSIMATPDNPVRNLVYMGVFYKLNERFIAERIEKSGMKEKVQQLGIQEPDMEFFKDVILTLSFNAGRGTAFALVDNFLKSRLANNRPLKKSDLNFLTSSIEEVRAIRKEPKDETPEAREKRVARLTQARDNAHTRSLPQFLRLMHGISTDFETDPALKRINGTPGYVSFVGDRQMKYDEELGVQTCTQPDFLQHK